MRRTAGLLVLHRGRILLVQHRYDKKKSHLSIPKGEIMNRETPLDAALRETLEETGILIPYNYIDNTPHISSMNNQYIQKYMVYYIVSLPNNYDIPNIKILDNTEIVWAGWVSYKDALTSIQQSQITLLFHIDERFIHPRILDYLTNYGYIIKAKHPLLDIYLYNYTDKCKTEEYWNEITLWCRGLILDSDNKILYRPFKKFFEYDQLYPEFIPNSEIFNIYEKMDGFLGIMYWIDGRPYIAARDSFISYPAIKANTILYTKYSQFFNVLNPQYTYLFEIIFPNKYLIINYGCIEDIYLIGIYDNKNNVEIQVENTQYPFSRAKVLNLKRSLSELLIKDNHGEEGYVVLYSTGERLKVKFPNYKIKYLIKRGK